MDLSLSPSLPASLPLPLSMSDIAAPSFHALCWLAVLLPGVINRLLWAEVSSGYIQNGDGKQEACLPSSRSGSVSCSVAILGRKSGPIWQHWFPVCSSGLNWRLGDDWPLVIMMHDGVLDKTECRQLVQIFVFSGKAVVKVKVKVSFIVNYNKCTRRID